MNLQKRFFIFLFIVFDAAIIFYLAFYFQKQNNLQPQVLTEQQSALTTTQNSTSPPTLTKTLTPEETDNNTETNLPIQLANECSSLAECEDRLVIEDDPSCQNNVQPALDLLKSDSPDNYYYALKYIGSIHCEEKGSGIYVWLDPPDVVLGQSTIDAGTVWLAGVLVHESRHAELYRQYLKENPTVSVVPQEVYSGKEAEQKCLDKQYQALVELGADQSTLDYVKNTINDKYWDVEYQDRWW